MKKLIGLTSILLTTGIAVLADPVTPTYTSIGSISGANFGGSGDPDTDVAITTIANDGNTITLGLQAQQRYSNPLVTDNGAGTYYATTGENYGNPATPTTPHTPSSYLGATWNFDFYVSIINGPLSGGNYTFALLYGTDASSLLTVDPVQIASLDSTLTPTTAQDSLNLLFSTFGGAAVPNTLSFNPNAPGIYSFELEAFDSSHNLIGTTAINVDVSSVPDVASTAWLLGLGFFTLAVFGFRQKRLQVAK